MPTHRLIVSGWPHIQFTLQWDAKNLSMFGPNGELAFTLPSSRAARMFELDELENFHTISVLGESPPIKFEPNVDAARDLRELLYTALQSDVEARRYYRKLSCFVFSVGAVLFIASCIVLTLYVQWCFAHPNEGFWSRIATPRLKLAGLVLLLVFASLGPLVMFTSARTLWRMRRKRG